MKGYIADDKRSVLLQFSGFIPNGIRLSLGRQKAGTGISLDSYYFLTLSFFHASFEVTLVLGLYTIIFLPCQRSAIRGKLGLFVSAKKLSYLLPVALRVCVCV